MTTKHTHPVVFGRDNERDADIMADIERAKRRNRSRLPLVAMAAYGMSDAEQAAFVAEFAEFDRECCK